MPPNTGVTMVPTTAPLISPMNGIMVPPARVFSQCPKDIIHRVISGSIRKSPTTSFATRSLTTPVATHNAMTNTYETQSNLTGSRAASGSDVIFVHVHNPTNYNSVTTYPMHKNVLKCSTFFESRLKALVSGLDLPAVHIATDPIHFKIVAHWLQNGQVINQAGSVPNLHSLAMLIFLADELELWKLVGQLVQIIRKKQYATDGSLLPSYFDIYKKTRTGNLFRRYVAESYIEGSALGRSVVQPPQALEDLPAGMLVDIITIQNEINTQFAAEWKMQSAEGQRKALTEMKKYHDDRHQKDLAAVTARYEEQFKRTKADLKAHYMKTYRVAEEKMKKRNDNLQLANRSVIDDSVNSNDIEVVKKMNQNNLAEIKKMNDERYNKLVYDTQKLNTDHMEAVNGMRTAHEERQANLQKEIADLKSALALEHAHGNAEQTRSGETDLNKVDESASELYRTRQELDALKKIIAENRAEITGLNRIHGEVTERHLKEVVDLQTAMAGADQRCRTEPADVTRMNEELSLPKTQNQLQNFNKVAEETRVQLTALQQAHSELKEQSQADITELRRINADCEESNRREVEHLIKVHEDANTRYQSELAAQKMMMEANENRNRKRIIDLKKVNEDNNERHKREMAELKKWKDKNEGYRRREVAELKRVNKELLEQLTVADDDKLTDSVKQQQSQQQESPFSLPRR